MISGAWCTVRIKRRINSGTKRLSAHCWTLSSLASLKCLLDFTRIEIKRGVKAVERTLYCVGEENEILEVRRFSRCSTYLSICFARCCYCEISDLAQIAMRSAPIDPWCEEWPIEGKMPLGDQVECCPVQPPLQHVKQGDVKVFDPRIPFNSSSVMCNDE